jgi:hypothetical protein
MGNLLVEKYGSIGTKAETLSSYGNYTTQNDCFLTWFVVLDSETPTKGDFSIFVGGVSIESSDTTHYQNFGMNWSFYGFVKKGTTIALKCPSKNYHLCKWQAMEFSIVT